jgi:branched-chain amino acid transport system ATP-binding protein
MVPEGRGVFTRMSIHENLQMGAFVRNDKGSWRRHRGAFGIFPRLKERTHSWPAR